VTKGTPPIFHLICFIVPCMNVYGLGLGISTYYKISNRRVLSDQRDSPYISFDLFYCPINEHIWFTGGDLDNFQILKRRGEVTLRDTCYI
jgi:hypothetical protein